MKKILSIVLSVVLIFGIVPMYAITVNAETSGYYTYTVSDGKATITDCNTSISGNVKIPSKLGGYPVISIGYDAFSNCISITSITIPEGIENIGEDAFFYCKNLTNISIPNSVTNIGSLAFYNCKNLKNVSLGNNVTSIGYRVFYGCSSLISITIPDSVTSIGEEAFCYCYNLTSITIPNSVKSIDACAFFDCTSLINVTLGNNVTNIGYRAFYGCSSLTSINLPDSIISIGESSFYNTAYYKNSSNWKNGVLYIGNHLIKSEDTLSGYYAIKSGTKTIANEAFWDCTNLTSITIPNSVVSIGNSAFWNCSSLINITIPVSVINIDKRAFYGCDNLISITISNGVVSIGDDAFGDCKKLESVIISNSVTSIGNAAFYNCVGLENIYFEGTAEEWEEITILSGNNYLKNANIYYNCSGIPGGATSVDISKLPDKVTYIENMENLDLTGGILTVYYDGGATNDIDLSTLNVSGFDNTVIGKQTLTVKYGKFLAEFEIEIIARPLAFIAISKSPEKREYLIGEELDLTGAKIVVGYPEGDFEFFELTADMVSGFDNSKSGYQILTVTYKGYTDELLVKVLEIGDLNCDTLLNAEDLILIRNALLSKENETKFDINSDGKNNIKDLVHLKKIIAGIIK